MLELKHINPLTILVSPGLSTSLQILGIDQDRVSQADTPLVLLRSASVAAPASTVHRRPGPASPACELAWLSSG